MKKISRRCFLKSSAVALSIGSTLLTTKAAAVNTENISAPNIVLVLSDDHSVPFLSCYGYPIKTPNLDKFASEGMQFDKAFTSAPQCAPSRASMMTGRSPVSVQMSRFSSPLRGDIPVLPELLKEKGYYTGVCRRSYHLDGSSVRGKNAPYVKALEKHGLKSFREKLDFVDVSGNREKTPEIFNTFLDQVPKDNPFFMWISFNDPHHPWDKNAISEPHDPAKIDVPAYLPDLPEIRKDLARHCDEISRCDEEFQWILDVLAKRKLDKNTIVIFMGDNGLAFPHGKGCLHDPGLHVPLLIRWPGVIPSGTTSNALISGEDLAPTLLDAVGLSPAKGMRGISFLKLLKHKPFEERKYIFAERGTHGGPPWTTMRKNIPTSAFEFSRCVRSRQYKLIYNCSPHSIYSPVDSSGLGYWKEMKKLNEQGKLDKKFTQAYFPALPRPVWEFYDLENDPAELNNQVDNPRYKTVIAELKQALMENMTLNFDFLPIALP